jgi:hypothetical protein
MSEPQWLTKQEVEERFRFDPEDSKYCPECLTKLRLSLEGEQYYCPNELCLNHDQYDLGGAIIPQGLI